MKTPVPQRAASRKKLAAKGQALPAEDGKPPSFPIPDVDYLKRAIRSVGRAPASKRPALKALIVKRARQLKATGAPGVKGTWAFQAANDSEAIDLAGPGGYIHGWIKVGPAGVANDKKTADKMTKQELQDHLASDHSSGVNAGGRALGPRNPSVAQLRARHEMMHAAAAAGGKGPGGSLVAMGTAHTHGMGSVPKPAGPGFANQQGRSIDLAAATRRRMPVVRGPADVQLARTAPGQITAQHKTSGMKIGMIAPKGNGYAGTHADGTGTGASGSQQGALTGLIAYHNKRAAGFPPAQQGGVAVMPGSKTYTAGAGAAVDLAGSLPVSTPASSASDGPKVTSMGGSSGGPAGLSPYAQGVYRKLLAKKLKPGVALMFAKRADAMHEKDAGGKASAA